MLNLIKNLFSKPNKPVQKEFSEEEFKLDYEQKSKGLENMLGKMHNLVGHAIIPFSIGGAVDMYYYPNHIEGTGFATMEILEPDGSGPVPNRLGTYELVAFTKHSYNTSKDENSPFNLIERKICGIFTTIGFYSRESELNPYDTCEIPNEDGEENTCIIFDLYRPDNKKLIIGDREHHLLLCLQIFRSELNFARENGTEALLNKLKKAGNYPYCDLDRDPVA